MRRIDATFPSRWLDGVMDAVRALRVPHEMSAFEVRFATRDAPREEIYRGATYLMRWETRTRLEIYVADRDADEVLRVVLAVFADESRLGGLVAVSRVEDAIQIRTEQRGEYAL